MPGAQRVATRRRAKAVAIGLALAGLLFAAGRTAAPSRQSSDRALVRAPDPCAVPSPSEIVLGCAPALHDWQDASILSADPLRTTRPDGAGSAPFALGAERLASAELARVPEPSALPGLVAGLAGFAALRRRASAAHSG